MAKGRKGMEQMPRESLAGLLEARLALRRRAGVKQQRKGAKEKEHSG